MAGGFAVCISMLFFLWQVKAELQFKTTNESSYLYKDGSTQILDCTVNNSMSSIRRIDWYRDDLIITSFKRSPPEIYTEDRQMMKIPKIKPRDSAQYRCEVHSIEYQEIDRYFNIPPVKAPFIIKQRQTYISVKEGEPVKFKCIVSPFYTRSYQWLFNGKEIKSDYTRRKIKMYKFFRIKKTVKGDAGPYVCTVRNDIGRREVTYILVVEAKNGSESQKPQLIKNVKTVLDVVMNDLTIDCTVTGARPINVTWIKNGKPLESQERKGSFQYKYYDNKQRLKLRVLLPSDRGMYTCIVQNRFGKMKHTFDVGAQEKGPKVPIFSNKDKKVIFRVEPGQNLTVTATVISFGTSHVQLLYHRNETIDNKTKTVLRLMETPRKFKSIEQINDITHAEERRIEIYFRNVSSKDYGTYSIMAGTNFGFDVYQFDIVQKTSEPEVVIGKTVAGPKKKSTQAPVIYIILACIVGLLFIIIVPVAIFLHRRRSKHTLNNNLKSLTSKPDVVLNLSDKEGNLTSISDGNIRRIHFSSRLSSCQTEKEYIYHSLPSDPEWEVPLENIEFKGILGEGAFGRVMLATVHALPSHVAPLTCAVKMLKEDATEQELKDLMSEIEVMKTIGKHENIIHLLGVSTQKGELCLVVEFCRYGNLRTFLKERRPTLPPRPPPIETLTLRHLTSFCLQVAKGMEYLSAQKCVHRDIAARNVLVADDYIVKIADFGLARDVHVSDYYRKCTDGRLPVKWMAMEALFDRVYTTQSDIWSFGILAWEIVTFGGSPYPGVPLHRLFDLLKDGYRMEKPVNCIDSMYTIMLNCWKESPLHRPTFSDLIVQLEKMLTDLNEVEYLVLQPPILSPYPTTSTSSQIQDISDSSGISSASVFDEEEDPIDNNTKYALPNNATKEPLLPLENNEENDLQTVELEDENSISHNEGSRTKIVFVDPKTGESDALLRHDNNDHHARL